MGRAVLSRARTPAHFGEAEDCHPRAYALLRAGAFHRARQGGGAVRRHGRGRVLAKEEGELVALVIGVGATVGVPGCARGDELLETWSPAAVSA